MRAASTLTILFAAAAYASPFDSVNELEERAGACNFYAASQIKACASGSQFCSSFLKTFPPVATTTSVIIQHATTVFVPTVVSTATAFSTTTTTSDFDNTCPNNGKRQAAGASCNVKAIEPTKIESGCSCLPNFTFKGKRPKPTTTSTVTTTKKVTDTSTTPTTTTKTSAATATATSFNLVVGYTDVEFQPHRYQMKLVLTGAGYVFQLLPYNQNNGASALTYLGYYDSVSQYMYGVIDNGTSIPLRGQLQVMGNPNEITVGCPESTCPSSIYRKMLIDWTDKCEQTAMNVNIRFETSSGQSALASSYVCGTGDGHSFVWAAAASGTPPGSVCNEVTRYEMFPLGYNYPT